MTQADAPDHQPDQLPEPPEPQIETQKTHTANLLAILTRTTAELVRQRHTQQALEAVLNTITSLIDGEEAALIETAIMERDTARLAAITRSYVEALRLIGVQLSPTLEDEIDEAVLEHQSRTVGLSGSTETPQTPHLAAGCAERSREVAAS